MIELFIDIETIPTSRPDIQARCVADVGPPANYKKAETIAQWWSTDGDAKKQDVIARTALNGTWGELLTMGFAINSEPVQVLERITTEYDLLNIFGLMIDRTCARADNSSSWQPVTRWIGHNILNFDLRFIWQRCRILGVRLPFVLPVKNQHHNVFDTMTEWAGHKEHISQRDLEISMNISRSDPLPNGGADVLQAYLEGRIEDIKAHNYADIEALREIYWRMVR